MALAEANSSKQKSAGLFGRLSGTLFRRGWMLASTLLRVSYTYTDANFSCKGVSVNAAISETAGSSLRHISASWSFRV